MSAWDLAWWVLVAAIIYTLVRPGSPAVAVVKAVSELTSGLVGAATGAMFVSNQGSSS